MKNILSVIFFFICLQTNAQKKITMQQRNDNQNFLENILKANPELKAILNIKDQYNVQIIYTKIDRDKNNFPHFTDYTFNVNKNNYFYPASTVKMPIAFLALEKMQELKKYGVDKTTAMITDSNAVKQTLVYNHPSSENGVPNIAHYIKQIFLVSDNDAFNRLYEFLGQEEIQKRLKKKGFEDAIIRHRLQVALTAEQNKSTNPIEFYDTTSKPIYTQAPQYSNAVYPTFNAQFGKGYYKGNELINEPFDFSTKNRIYLEDLHQILRTILFPETISSRHRFNINKEDEQFLLHWMSAYPNESKYPNYDSTEYWDAYCKFMLLGSEKTKPDSSIRIFNKVGDAYGFLTDISYIVDFKNNVEFMLSATILCNNDGIFNDDKYDYDGIGFPFMKNLGKTIYQYELGRTKSFIPDLTKFKFDYSQLR